MFVDVWNRCISSSRTRRTYEPDIETWRKRDLPIGASVVLRYPDEPVVIMTRSAENSWEFKSIEYVCGVQEGAQ